MRIGVGVLVTMAGAALILLALAGLHSEPASAEIVGLTRNALWLLEREG